MIPEMTNVMSSAAANGAGSQTIIEVSMPVTTMKLQMFIAVVRRIRLYEIRIHLFDRSVMRTLHL
jgi:chemotaxis protein CheY-P-specific phosphatase CheC